MLYNYPNPVHRVQSTGSFTIIGRGRAFSIENPIDCPNFDYLMNHVIEIDGQLYTVHGIERFCIPGPYWKGMPISVLVKPFIP